MLIRVVTAIAAGWLSLTAATGPAHAQRTSPLQGVWTGQYTCGGSTASLRLILSPSADRFAFSYPNGVEGEYRLATSYDPKARRFFANPRGGWISERPRGFSMVGLRGTVSGDMRTMSGNVETCGPFTLRLDAGATIPSDVPRSSNTRVSDARSPDAPGRNADETCSSLAAAPPPSKKYDLNGVSLGMTEAQAIQGACRASNNDVVIISRPEGRTHFDAKTYTDTKEFVRADYHRASAALGKPYQRGLVLCVNCNGKSSVSYQSPSSQARRLTISLLPDGKIYKLETGVAFGANPQELHTLMAPLENRFGSPSFRQNDYGAVQTGWRFTDSEKPAPLELWYKKRDARGQSTIQYKDDGLIWTGGIYKYPALRKENPQTSYCMSEHFGHIGLAFNAFFRKGSETDHKLRVERMSHEQMSRETINFVAPGHARRCGVLTFSEHTFEEKDMRDAVDNLRDNQSYKSMSGTRLVKGYSVKVLDASALEAWRETERQQVEGFIRASKR